MGAFTVIPWSIGVTEYWSVGTKEVTAILREQEMAIVIFLTWSKKTGHHPQIQYSSTPILQHSSGLWDDCGVHSLNPSIVRAYDY